ncbi:polysaccharide deacetylase family protein [Aliarcobacter butzleri]|uniref:polysaccharide deacetylase family protein n=1 Tax=Aliarcobacter butzleri TaxID=28197 RepID=UPI0024DE1D7C|nr:polysaccharide deacetylase family protein [Aliarcobacter butzleri]MDK2070554.1 polysaccharide deacetylase family protein [Aliarcobacter butzleri]MDN5078079.1 polysaccharide deacetylase family protein [Aliarcobacter butzleri]MDN5119407.1 polysaccharide deacetylase family protein [Aliarcobacter butzleri]
MLISIMYHHVNSDRCSNDLVIFEEHLKYIKTNFKTIFPGEKVEKNSLCLTFDDAYADFYFLIFPLLKKYNLKALLAIPSKYILNDTEENSQNRMNFEHNALFENYQKATFCTYKELKEMRDSGLVIFGSHSHSHVNLLEENIDLDLELRISKEILEKNLNVKIESFVFPFGKYNQKILQEAKKYYKYNFRIGNAIHKDFNGINEAIYRVDGDGLKSADEIFKTSKLLKYKFKGLVKRLGKK